MKALHLSSSKYTQLLLNMPVFAAFPGAFAKYVVDGSKKQREVHPMAEKTRE